VSIDALESHLPPRERTGRSMSDLRDTARAFGLTLTGVKLTRSDRAPDRPALVFLRREDHGHFLVVRPVGHSGKLVQIIDATGDPTVIDAANLYASPQWTGLALVPSRTNWPFRLAVGILVAGCVTLILTWGLLGHRRNACPKLK